MNDIEKVLDRTSAPLVNVPYFQQRLRSRLLEHRCWRKRSYASGFFCTAALAGVLSVLRQATVTHGRATARQG